MYVCMYVYMHMYMYKHVYVCVCVYIYSIYRKVGKRVRSVGRGAFTIQLVSSTRRKSKAAGALKKGLFQGGGAYESS